MGPSPGLERFSLCHPEPVRFRLLPKHSQHLVQSLRETDKSKGITVRVLDEQHQDVTDAYAKWLGEGNQAIRQLLSAFDYNYLYNGFLQHSDPKFSKRLFQDYVSGEINYLRWKHVLPLGVLMGLLRPYYMLMRSLTFPSLGPL